LVATSKIPVIKVSTIRSPVITVYIAISPVIYVRAAVSPCLSFCCWTSCYLVLDVQNIPSQITFPGN